MKTDSNIIEKIQNWLSAGTSAEGLIKKVLLITVSILIIYRLGYVIGKMLFHIRS